MSVAAVWRRSWKRIFDFSGRGHSFMRQRGLRASVRILRDQVRQLEHEKQLLAAELRKP